MDFLLDLCVLLLHAGAAVVMLSLAALIAGWVGIFIWGLLHRSE